MSDYDLHATIVSELEDLEPLLESIIDDFNESNPSGLVVGLRVLERRLREIQELLSEISLDG